MEADQPKSVLFVVSVRLSSINKSPKHVPGRKRRGTHPGIGSRGDPQWCGQNRARAADGCLGGVNGAGAPPPGPAEESRGAGARKDEVKPFPTLVFYIFCLLSCCGQETKGELQSEQLENALVF